MTNDRKLDELLARHFSAKRDNDESVARVSARLSGPLPRQKGRLFGGWQGIVLDWQFAPAWPRMAALAACAVFGLIIGFSGIDSGFGRFDSPFASASAADFTNSVFESEPIFGGRP